MRANGKIVLCFFGDGASNQGTFHESLNMAAIWKLPVVFLCENNLYAMSTPIRYAARVPDLAARAAGYGLPGHSRGDPRRYRTAAEEAAWREKDPIARFRACLVQQRFLTPAQDRTVRRDVADVVRKAVRFARSSPWPDVATLTEGVFA